MNINQVMIYGNLTRDPEMKTLPSGIAVTNFSVATNRSYKDRDCLLYTSDAADE